MNKSIKIKCPAKINLTLKVVGKRPDGFHDIDSVMQTINLFDYLTIEVTSSEAFNVELSGNSDEIPYNEKNLVYKAAKLFFENFKTDKYCVKIYIDKNIPISAGLAGGSTDAAGTLYGLNQIFDSCFSKSKLHELCATLGSDLNLCLEGGRQQTYGRGEILVPLEFEEFELSIIKPVNLGISAKEAYTKFSEKHQQGLKNTEFLNDLEWAVFDDYQELQEIKRFYPNSVMSGSGTTYYEINGTFEPMEGYFVKNNLKSIPYGVVVVD